jgi:hypothetical protein
MMNLLQARLVVSSLEIEISSDGRMQMTREPAMKTLGRLCGFDAYATFGKGVKGRQKALEWLLEVIADTEAEYNLEPGTFTEKA